MQPITFPLDLVSTSEPIGYTVLKNERASMDMQGYVISDSCSEENLVRFMAVADYLFTDEGEMFHSYGLTDEQFRN